MKCLLNNVHCLVEMDSTIRFQILDTPLCISLRVNAFGEKRGPLSIFTNLSARVGYDTRSIFKQSLTGLNSEFSFS